MEKSFPKKPKEMKQLTKSSHLVRPSVQSAPQKTDYVWSVYSFYGAAVSMKVCEKPGRLNRRAFDMTALGSADRAPKGYPDGTPFRFSRIRPGAEELVSDGGGTITYMKTSHRMTWEQIMELLQRLYRANAVCLVGDELCVAITSKRSAERAGQLLKSFIDSVLVVCDTIC